MLIVVPDFQLDVASICLCQVVQQFVGYKTPLGSTVLRSLPHIACKCLVWLLAAAAPCAAARFLVPCPLRHADYVHVKVRISAW